MKALILNSGMGTRMGDETKLHPKCMTCIGKEETILSRQLKQLVKYGVTDAVITTGYFSDILIQYCEELKLPLNIRFVKNEKYDCTNYIYSIYCAKDYLKDTDIIMMHGDLVFDDICLDRCMNYEKSCMVVDSMAAIPEKDFKAVISDGCIQAVGTGFFKNVYAAQPLYKIFKHDWNIWLESIVDFCEEGMVSCYAENAFNQVSNLCKIYPLDVAGKLCAEIDTPEDWTYIKEKLSKMICRE